MTADFRIHLEFSGSTKKLELPEDVTEAHFAIYANHDCLTLNRRAGRSHLLSASESVFGPVAGLADWFIENWGPMIWESQTPFVKSRDIDVATGPETTSTIRENADEWSDFLEPAFARYAEEMEAIHERLLEVRADWQHRHLLGHGCSDLAIPRILIVPEDRSTVLIVDGLPNGSGAPIDFLSPGNTPRHSTVLVVSKDTFRSEVKQFVEETIRQAKTADDFAPWANWLEERWATALQEEKDPRRRLKWMIGDLSAKRVHELQHSRPDLAISLEKILRDCPIVTDKRELTPVESLIDNYVTKTSSAVSERKLTWQGFGRGSVDVSQPDYRQGYELARLARKRLGIADRPIRDLSEVLGRFGVNLEKECQSPLFRVAVCASKNAGAHIVPSSNDSRMRNIPGFRFGVSSGLGRLLWQGRSNPSQPICAAQGDHAMISQSRRANAFAAELLLPGEVIRGLNPQSQEFLDRVEAYGVSRSAARWHLHNVNVAA